MGVATPLNATDLLASVPVRNEAVKVEHKTQTELLLTVPLRRRWYMKPPVSWLVPTRPMRKIALDGLGAEFWQLCDSRRTMEQIIDMFAQRHDLTFHEARLSLSQFARSLAERGLIVLVGPSGETQR